MNSRKLWAVLTLAALATIAIVRYWPPIPYAERLIRIQAGQELGWIDERITREPLATQAILLDYAADRELTLKAWLALSKYPAQTRNILSLYGSEQEFKDILRSYGEAIIPVIQYFLDHEVSTLTARHAVTGVVGDVVDATKRTWARMSGNAATAAAPARPPRELGPTGRGWYAVNFIRKEGHAFLAEFAVDKDKVAKWNQTRRFTEGLTSFFTSGIRDLETKVDLNEKVTAGDILVAGLDVVPFAVSIKLLRAGKVVAASGKELTLASRTRLFGARLLPKGALVRNLGKYGAVVAIAYVVVTHPSLVSSLLGELAELLGWNPLLVQLLGWFLIVSVLLYPFSWVLMGLARAILLGLSLLERPRRQRA